MTGSESHLQRLFKSKSRQEVSKIVSQLGRRLGKEKLSLTCHELLTSAQETQIRLGIWLLPFLEKKEAYQLLKGREYSQFSQKNLVELCAVLREFHEKRFDSIIMKVVEVAQAEEVWAELWLWLFQKRPATILKTLQKILEKRVPDSAFYRGLQRVFRKYGKKDSDLVHTEEISSFDKTDKSRKKWLMKFYSTGSRLILSGDPSLEEVGLEYIQKLFFVKYLEDLIQWLNEAGWSASRADKVLEIFLRYGERFYSWREECFEYTKGLSQLFDILKHDSNTELWKRVVPLLVRWGKSAAAEGFCEEFGHIQLVPWEWRKTLLLWLNEQELSAPSAFLYSCLEENPSSEVHQLALQILRGLLSCFSGEILGGLFSYLEEVEDIDSFLPALLEFSGKVSELELEDEIESGLERSLQKRLLTSLTKEYRPHPLVRLLFKRICKYYSDLEEYGTFLTNIDFIPPCYEREEEVELLLKRLKREGNKSFILLGPSGCGKSALIHELAFRLATMEEEYPFEMVLQITTGNLLAGTKYLGEWETRVHRLIQELKNYGKVVLYVSNINDLIWAGRSSSSRTNFASVMAPYIERGEIVVIGDSTPEAYSMGIASEHNIKKLFHTIQIKEMDDNATERVLKKVASCLKEHILGTKNLEIEVPSTVLSRIIELSGYYFPGIAKPGSAVNLLQQVMESKGEEEEERSNKGKTVVLTPDDVMQVLAKTMEVPELIINDAVKLDIEQAYRFFEERVLGQPQAISAVVSLVTLIKAGLTNPERPHGVFFFLGPTGVGKTELARVLAEFLTGDPDRLIRIDMSAFKDYSSFERLIGSHQLLTPQGTPIAPNLVEKIRNRPFSVILLDEFEKAHPNIFDLFLQVFDYGKLMDSRSEIIDFRQSIILMTSNLGFEEALGARVGFDDKECLGITEEEAKREMGRFFRPEFINRIDRIVVFNPLDKETMRKITRREIGQILSRSGIVRRNLAVEIREEVIHFLMEKGFSPKFGARHLKRAVEQHLLLPLAETIVKKRPENGSSILVCLNEGKVEIEVGESRATSRRSRFLETVRRKRRSSASSFTLEEVEHSLEELKGQIATLEAYCEVKDYPRWKRELYYQTKQVTFWDNPQRARMILEEMHYLERILQSINKLHRDLAQLEEHLRHSQGQVSAMGLEQLVLRSLEIRREYEVVDFEARCGPKERSDAFLVLEAEACSPWRRKGLEILRELYRRWAERNMYSIGVLEDMEEEGVGRISYYIQGPCVYGLLRREQGEHIVEEKRGEEVVKDCVRVRVYPNFMEEEAGYRGGKDSKGTRFFNPQGFFRSASLRKENGDVVERLKKILRRSLDKGVLQPTRTYRVGPKVEIYDHILGKMLENPLEFLGGDLDELLLERAKLGLGQV
ncbi:MAG: AAA family ATPase [Planctomycetota bacterium]|nr:MAG: AAA family ATPase [Planctomycetota bacterium]